MPVKTCVWRVCCCGQRADRARCLSTCASAWGSATKACCCFGPSAPSPAASGGAARVVSRIPRPADQKGWGVHPSVGLPGHVRFRLGPVFAAFSQVASFRYVRATRLCRPERVHMWGFWSRGRRFYDTAPIGRRRRRPTGDCAGGLHKGRCRQRAPDARRIPCQRQLSHILRRPTLMPFATASQREAVCRAGFIG